jgi:uncharacterized protein
MIPGSFRNSSPIVKILFALFAVVVGFTIFIFIGIIFASIFFGTGLDALSGKIDASNPGNIPVLKFLQACFSIGLFVFPPILTAWFLNGKIGGYLKLDKTFTLYGLMLAILLLFFSIPIINFLVMINKSIKFPEFLKGMEDVFKNMENSAEKTTNAFLEASSVKSYLINLLVIALIPAIGEELTFRGIFQRLFHEWTKNIHIAIFASAFIFSALHFQFYGFFARWFLGILLGYLFYWSGNLWLPIIAHFFNNSLAVTLFYIKGDLAKKADNIGTGREMVPSVIFSTVLLIVLLYLVYRTGKENSNKTTYPDKPKLQQ